MMSCHAHRFGGFLLGAALLATATPAVAAPWRLGVDYALEGTLRDAETSDHVLNGILRTRIGSPWGDFVQSGYSRYDSGLGERQAWRGETYWRYQHAASGLTYRLGDFRAGTSVGWIRSYDVTGVQIRRRAGRVAMDTIEAVTPDPGLLRNVDPNAWNWDAIPALPGARAAGVLGQGVAEYGAQSGYLQLNRGSAESQYADTPTVSAGLRYGVFDQLTAETYVESSDSLVHQGAGVIGDLGSLGQVGLAASFSRDGLGRGNQVMATYRGSLGPLDYFAGTQRRTSGFNDALSLARQQLGRERTDHGRIDTVGVSLAMPQARSTLRVTYVRLSPEDLGSTHDDASRLLNVGHATQVGRRLSWYTSAYTDLDHASDFGLYVGVRLPLGPVARAGPQPLFDFGPGIDQRASSSATVRGAGSFRVDEGVRVEAGLSETYARESTIW